MGRPRKGPRVLGPNKDGDRWNVMFFDGKGGRKDQRFNTIEDAGMAIRIFRFEHFERFRVTKEKEPLNQDRKVYFIRVGEDGPIKIGSAKDVRNRMHDLQQAHYDVLYLLAVTHKHREVDIHMRFKSLRLRGEWFRPEPELMEFIAQVQREYGELLKMVQPRRVRFQRGMQRHTQEYIRNLADQRKRRK